MKAQSIKNVEHEAKDSREASDIVADGRIVGLGLVKRERDGRDDADGDAQSQMR